MLQHISQHYWLLLRVTKAAYVPTACALSLGPQTGLAAGSACMERS